MTDVRAALVAEMNRPADPRRASAEALLTRLEHEFGDLDALRLGQADGAPLEAAGPAPVRLRRWRVAGPARATRAPTWRVAAAFAAAVVVGGVLVVARDASTPASALSVLRAARERFADLPPFEADVFRRHPGADVADLSAGADPVPDLETEHLVQYEDEAHWRTTVVRNSYDAAPEELRSLAPERAGDFAVAGGGRVGTWLGGPGRFVVSPLADLDRSGRLARATASLSPELGAFEALDAAVEGDGCRVAPDETVLGRRAERVDCRGQSGRWDTSLWLDSATGIVLRLTAATGDRGQVLSPPFLVEVRRLDLSPAFGPATFTVEAPAGARTVWAGNGPAPEEYRVQPGPSVTHRIPVAPGGTSALAVGDDGAVWALGWARRPQPGEADPDRTLSRIDARSAEVTFSVPVSRYAQSVAVAGGWVWVAGTELVAEGSSDDKGNVTPARYAAVVERYEPATGRSAGVPLRIDGSGDTGILVVAGDELWFTGGPGHEFATGRSTASYSTLVRIDTATGAIAGELPVAGAVLGADATGRGGALWMMVSSVEPSDRENPDRPAVVALDPGSGAETARFPVAGPLSFAVGDGDLWVLMAETGPDTPAALRRIEARTGRELGRAEVGPEPMAVAAAGGSVWVTNRDDGTLLRLDPGTLEVRQVVVVGGSPGRIAWSAGAVWVADALEGTVSRVVP